MPYKRGILIMKRFLLFGIVLIVVGLFSTKVYTQYWDMPKLPPPELYGNLLIDRVSTKKGVKPVTFSHWIHRTKYTCRVCHFELDFAMKAGQTEITEEDNKNGLFCGACHDGKVAFGHTKENCEKCHNGRIDYGKEKFAKLKATLPPSEFGNKIDWVEAVRKGLIVPKQTIYDEEYKPIKFKKQLKLEAEWALVPPAYFSHEAHSYWLDCANCHPDIFNIKKKTTKHFSMMYNLRGRFCGACHLKVAFPMNDCKGCHPEIRSSY